MSEDNNGAAAAADNVVDMRFWQEQQRRDDGGGEGGGGGAGGGAEGEGPRPTPASDDQLALQLVGNLGHDWKYVARWGDWLNWDGVRWRRDERLTIVARARGICRDLAARLDSPSLARNVSSAKTIHAAVALARTDRRIVGEHDVWDRDPWLLNTPGGIVDLRTGALGRHERERMMMHVAGAAPEGECPHWRRFVAEIAGGNQAFADYLQRLVGYALTGSTREEMFAFLHGPSNTGKSKFVEALRRLFGSYATSAPMDTFTATKAERHPTDLAGFAGKRLVTAAETEEGRRWDQQRMTALTGRDEIQARFMRGDFFGYTPQFLLLFHGNYRPRLNSADPAMRRRLQLIPFRYKPARIDEQLIDKFTAELGGIMVWAVEGAALWYRFGLQPPPLIAAATDKYFAAENALGQWIDERCERDASLTALTQDLYRDYGSWAKSGGEYVLPVRRFHETLEMLLGEACEWKDPKTRRRGFRGLALRVRAEELPF